MKPVVIIPARMESSRLPGKPLADINGKPMIIHVVERAKEADIGNVIVACSETEVFDCVSDAGNKAIMTDPNHPSGSDRIFEALCKADPYSDYNTIVNVQGDLPTIDPEIIRASLNPMENPEVDISTLITKITREEEKTNPNVVKAAVSLDLSHGRIGRAVYFSRNPVPSGDGDLYHHIGLYAYRRASLEKFIATPQGILEKRERLEQLRALEYGMRIDAILVDTVPFGVDTKEDLERAKELLKNC
ncbi:MAG: 3-deoxy-manno-octulosonate cytidylyltransferase [Alphaproteobacteria bacterium]|nr:3-deoxy-manno-octulosonate cytidylyltransferase [Alphaproteobacteria bacterium]